MIRHATDDDEDMIQEMCRKFYATTAYPKHTEYDEPTIRKLIQTCSSTGVLLVADVGKLVGFVALYVGPSMWRADKLGAVEVAWWVDPKYQSMGIGKELLESVEPACKAAGCNTIQMAALHTSPPIVDTIYKKAGYSVTEITYTKVI